MMEWTDALRKYASMKGVKYHIPKKGTEAYNEVKKIQASGTGALTKKDRAKIVNKMAGKSRKERSDKGMKRGARGSIMGSDTGKMMESLEKSMPSKKMRKVRSDKGKKRMSKKSLAGIVGDTAKEMMAIESSLPKTGAKKARKVRSDKGKKRGPRSGMPSDFSAETKAKAIASKTKTLRFDEEGNIM